MVDLTVLILALSDVYSLLTTQIRVGNFVMMPFISCLVYFITLVVFYTTDLLTAIFTTFVLNYVSTFFLIPHYRRALLALVEFYVPAVLHLGQRIRGVDALAHNALMHALNGNTIPLDIAERNALLNTLSQRDSSVHNALRLGDTTRVAARRLASCALECATFIDDLTPPESDRVKMCWILARLLLAPTVWFITNAAHNKFMHALNGNGDSMPLFHYEVESLCDYLYLIYCYGAVDDDYHQGVLFTKFQKLCLQDQLTCINILVQFKLDDDNPYSLWIALNWNTIMHALNGNIFVFPVGADHRSNPNFAMHVKYFFNRLALAYDNGDAVRCIIDFAYDWRNVVDDLGPYLISLTFSKEDEIREDVNDFMESYGEQTYDRFEFSAVLAKMRNRLMHALNGNSIPGDDSYRRRFRAKLKTKLEKRQLWRIRVEEIHRVKKQQSYEVDPVLEKHYSRCLLLLDGILWDVCYSLVAHQPHHFLKDINGRVMRKKQFERYVHQLDLKRSEFEQTVEATAQVSFSWVTDFATKIYKLIDSVRNTLNEALAQSLWWSAFVSGCTRVVSFFSRLVAMAYAPIQSVAAILLSIAADFGSWISDKFHTILKQLFEKSYVDESETIHVPSPLGTSYLDTPISVITADNGCVEADAQVPKPVLNENVFAAASGFITGIFGGDSNSVLRDRADLVTKTMGLALTTKNFVLLCRDVVLYVISKFDQIIIGFDGSKLDESVQKRLIDWMKSVPILLDFPTTEFNEQRVARVHALKGEMDAIGAAVIDSGEDLRNLLYVPSVINRVNAYFSEAQTFVKHSPTRVEPLGLYGEGKPGIGKSAAMTDACISMVRLATGLPIEADLAHTRNPNDKWWDRMKPDCKILVYDEFKAGVDPQLREQMSLELLGLISTACFPTPAANMSLKATHEFRGWIVAALCNNSNLMADNLQDPNALWRRGYIIQFSVKEDNYNHETNRAIRYEKDYSHLTINIFKRSTVKTTKGQHDDIRVAGPYTMSQFIAWGASEIRNNLRIASGLEDKSYFRNLEVALYDKDVDPVIMLERINNKYNAPVSNIVEAKPQMFSFWKTQNTVKEIEPSSSPSERDIILIDIKSTWVSMLGTMPFPCSDSLAIATYLPIKAVAQTDLAARVRTVEKLYHLFHNDVDPSPAIQQEAYFSRGVDYMREKFGEGWRFLQNNWKGIMKIIAAALAIIFVFLLVKWFGDDDVDALGAAKYPGGEVQASKPRRYHATRLPTNAAAQSSLTGKFSTTKEETFIAHNGWTEAVGQLAGAGVLNKIRKIRGNYCYFEVYTIDNTAFDHAFCIGLGIAEQWVLVVGHILGAVNLAQTNGSQVLLRVKTTSGLDLECKWSEIEDVILFQTADSLIDAALVKLPRRFGQFPNIINHFPKSVKDTAFQNVFSVIPDQLMEGDTYLVSNHDVRFFDQKVITRGGGVKYYTANSVQSVGIDGTGMCGTMLVTLNPKVESPIVGMLYATVQKSGGEVCLHAIITSDELVARIGLQKGHDAIDELLEERLIDAKAQGVVFPNNAQVLGVIKKSFKNSLPGTSKIEESLIYNNLLSKYAPARLRPFQTTEGLVNPRRNCVVKWGVPVYAVKPKTLQFLRIATDAMKKEVLSVKPQMRRMQSLDEALNSSQLLDQRSINVAASLGTPAKFLFKGKGKSGAIYQNEHQHYIPTVAFKAYWLKIKLQLEQGIRPSIIFTQQLKDELRELLKVYSGSTRQFTAGEVCEVIGSRIYFGDFNQVFREYLKTGFCVGVNLNGNDARAIYETFLNHFEVTNFLAIDSEKNDTQFRDALYEAIQEIYRAWYNKWYNPSSAYYLEADLVLEDGLPLNGKDAYERGCRARDALFECQRYARVLYDEYLVEHIDKLPSGSGQTINWNCAGNKLIANTNILSILYENSIASPPDLNEVARVAVLGDDILGGSDAIKYPCINVQSMVKANTENFQRTYTGTRKDGKPLLEIVLHARNENDVHVTFCKRSFEILDGVMFCPLKKEVIHEIPMWVNNDGRSMEARTREVTEAAMREWFQHGPKEYKTQCNELNARLELANCEPVIISYLHLLADWCGNH